MTPYETKKKIADQLRVVFLEMMEPEWQMKAQALPEDERQQAAMAFMRIYQAKIQFENAVLADIRDQLVEHEAEIQAGIDALEESRRNLDQIEKFLGNVGNFINTLAKLIPLPV